jgi:hypothetical protein
MRCDNCRCRVSQIEADRAAEKFSVGVTLCESCASAMRGDEKQLRVWCDVHRGEAITDAGEVPACLDWYPVVDSDGDLTGSIASAQDADYRLYQTQPWHDEHYADCVVCRN